MLHIRKIHLLFSHISCRKKRLKRLARNFKHQHKSKTAYSVHSNGVSTLPTFSQSPVRYSSPGIQREETPLTMHPAAVRKKKNNFQMHQSLDANKNPETSEKKRRHSRRSITPVNERPQSREWHGNGKVPPERRGSKIPIPVKSRKKSRRKNSIESVKSHYANRHSSFETNIAIIDREDPYKIDMDSVRSSKDRRKWEIPVAQSIEYDPQRSFRLPPLLELRAVNTA